MLRSKIVAWALVAAALLFGLAPQAVAQPTWTLQQGGTTQDLWTVSFGAYNSAQFVTSSFFVAAGTGGAILTSPDGVAWTAQQSPTSAWLVASIPHIIVGDQGTILTSNDGVNWVERSSAGARLNGVAAGGNITLAVGEGGAVARSLDNGLTWTWGNAGVTSWLRGVVWNERLNRFEISGEGGVFLTSPDGVSFSPASSGTADDLEGLAREEEGQYAQLVSVGANGYLASSVDGMNWQVFGAGSSVHYRGASIQGNVAVAVGTNGATAFGYFNPSAASNSETDPVETLPNPWEIVSAGTDQDLYAAGWGQLGSTVIAVAVGQAGTICTSRYYNALPGLVSGLTGPSVSSYGQTVILSAVASGEPGSWQWTFNGQPISGATSPTLTIADIGPGQIGQYGVTITNTYGTVSIGTYQLNAVFQPTVPGLIDPTFNRAPTSFPNLTAAAVQPDGKVVATTNLTVMRFNADGSADTAFDTVAMAISPGSTAMLGTGFDTVIIQADGKILVTGTWYTFPLDAMISRSWRLNSDGSIDSTYAPPLDQIAGNLDIPPTQDELPLVALANGQYLTMGYKANSPPLVVRLNSDGTADPTFTAYAPSGELAGSSVVMREDHEGRVAMAVSYAAGQIGYDQTYVCRLNPDGTQDMSFSSQVLPGSLTAGPFFITNDQVVCLTQQVTSSGLTYHLRGVNFSYGALDLPSGGAAPIWNTPVGIVGSDGSIYLNFATSGLGAPLALIQGTYRNGIIRIDPQGNYDPTFALNLALAGPGSGNALLGGVAACPNGQWILWGSFDLFDGASEPGIARINPAVGANFASLVNVSAQAVVATGIPLTVGISIAGSASLPVLIRGVGPALASFQVGDPLPDPTVALYAVNGPTTVVGSYQAYDDNWNDNGQTAAIVAATTAAGAFQLVDGSSDAALVSSLTPGTHTFAVITGNQESGAALGEVYSLAASPVVFGAIRPINLSFLGLIGSGNAITGGFVIGGNNLKHVLLRAIGPGLATFGVSSPLADPVLTLYGSGSLMLASNQGWSQNAYPASVLAATFSDVGAFALPTGNADAALALDLGPGSYTVEATSASRGQGTVLVEIYEVP